MRKRKLLKLHVLGVESMVLELGARLDLKKVLEVAPHGLFAVDRNRNVVLWNRAAERITGLSADTVLGRQCPFLELSPQCQESCALLNGGAGREEVEIFTDEGKKILKKSFEVLKDDDGNVTGCVECFMDITGVKAAEEEAERARDFYADALREAKAMQEFYADVLNNLQTFVVVVDENGKIELINDAILNVEGLHKDEILGKDFVEVHWWQHSEDAKETARRILEDALSGKVTFTEVYAMTRRGRLIPLLAYGVPLRRSDGSIRGAVLVGQDITEKKELERKLQETIQKLKAAQEELSTPVVQVWDGVLALPIIGVVDSDRAMKIMETLLNKIVETQSEFVILDVTGVASIDTEVANHLMKTVQAASLLGAECIITGIKPEVAQTMIQLGLEIDKFVTRRDLQDGLKYVLRRRGVQVAEG